MVGEWVTEWLKLTQREFQNISQGYMQSAFMRSTSIDAVSQDDDDMYYQKRKNKTNKHYPS